MAVAPALSFPQSFAAALDELLIQVCEEVQLTPTRHDLAVARYDALNKVLESAGSPFRFLKPEIYPQGSMALGTTVAPVEGPHDLDFVLELSRSHVGIDPMGLIRLLHGFLRQHGTYGSMTRLKRRCVRIEYADEFYMDVLPACRNLAFGGTCVKVPDRAVQGWSDSNPKGYVDWFKKRSRMIFVGRMMDKAAPIPDQQAVAEKDVLQLLVQLAKRWRDLYYADMDRELAPISVVLTTLAAETYRGERSLSLALTSMLDSIVDLIDHSRSRGEKHLHLCNPSNAAEDLTERWDSNPAAYGAFDRGIRDFRRRWSQLVTRQGNGDAELVALFGEPVTKVLRKRLQRIQESRLSQKLGVTSAGVITSSAGAAAQVRPNTFYGAE